MRAEDVRQHPEQVAVPAAVVDDRLNPHFLLNQDRGREHAHTALRPWPVWDIHRVHARRLEQCRALKAAGVDAVNVPDGPRAQSRMGVLPSAILIQKEVGIETVIHYCCRDRNLLGMLSDILGAHAAGLRNILIITGDPPKMGPYPEATAVF